MNNDIDTNSSIKSAQDSFLEVLRNNGELAEALVAHAGGSGPEAIEAYLRKILNQPKSVKEAPEEHNEISSENIEKIFDAITSARIEELDALVQSFSIESQNKIIEAALKHKYSMFIIVTLLEKNMLAIQTVTKKLDEPRNKRFQYMIITGIGLTPEKWKDLDDLSTTVGHIHHIRYGEDLKKYYIEKFIAEKQQDQAFLSNLSQYVKSANNSERLERFFGGVEGYKQAMQDFIPYIIRIIVDLDEYNPDTENIENVFETTIIQVYREFCSEFLEGVNSDEKIIKLKKYKFTGSTESSYQASSLFGALLAVMYKRKLGLNSSLPQTFGLEHGFYISYDNRVPLSYTLEKLSKYMTYFRDLGFADSNESIGSFILPVSQYELNDFEVERGFDVEQMTRYILEDAKSSWVYKGNQPSREMTQTSLISSIGESVLTLNRYKQFRQEFVVKYGLNNLRPRAWLTEQYPKLKIRKSFLSRDERDETDNEYIARIKNETGKTPDQLLQEVQEAWDADLVSLIKKCFDNVIPADLQDELIDSAKNENIRPHWNVAIVDRLIVLEESKIEKEIARYRLLLFVQDPTSNTNMELEVGSAKINIPIAAIYQNKLNGNEALDVLINQTFQEVLNESFPELLKLPRPIKELEARRFIESLWISVGKKIQSKINDRMNFLNQMIIDIRRETFPYMLKNYKSLTNGIFNIDIEETIGLIITRRIKFLLTGNHEADDSYKYRDKVLFTRIYGAVFVSEYT